MGSISAVVFNPAGVGSVEVETCVPNGETVRQGASSSLSVKNTSKHPLFNSSPCTLSSPPNICPLSPSVSSALPSHISTGSISLLPDSFGLYLLSVCSSVVAIISADFFSSPPTCYCDSQPTPSLQTFPLQSNVFVPSLLHILSVVSCGGMKKNGVEEEIMVCLWRAKQKDWQMDSPSDAQQR